METTPSRIDLLAAKYGEVHQVPKRCHRCGAHWWGNSFLAAVEGEVPRTSTCDNCLQAEEDRAAALKKRPDELVKVIDLEAPREPGE